jgi:hypothetical protein
MLILARTLHVIKLANRLLKAAKIAFIFRKNLQFHENELSRQNGIFKK